MGNDAQDLETTVAALCSYVDEALGATLLGESKYAYAVEHLLAMLQRDAGEDHPSAHTSLLYFVANYTMARYDRDSTEAEAAALADLAATDVQDVVDHVRDHPALGHVVEAWKRMTGVVWVP